MTAAPPARCNRCHRVVPTGALVAGYGVKCAKRYGLAPVRRVRVGRHRNNPAVEQPPLDGLEINEKSKEA